MNWDDKSDAEINFKLWNLYAKIPDGHATICIYDYCNSWSIMGPLIQEHQLHLDPRKSLEKLPWMVSLNDQVWATDKNPLRAAAICLIKKLEAEQ